MARTPYLSGSDQRGLTNSNILFPILYHSEYHMKHALLLAAMVFATVAGVAQIAANGNNDTRYRIPMKLTPADIMPQPAAEKPSERGQGIAFTRVFTTEVRSQFHYWPSGTSSNDIFIYDARSNSLNIARNRALFDAANQIMGVEIGVVRSTNNGSAWTFDIVQRTTDMFFGMPVLGMVNPNEVSDPSQYPIAVYGIRYPMPNLNYGGMSLWNRGDNGPYELPLNDQTPPASGYAMAFGDVYADKTGAGVHIGGILNPTGTQYGAYGYFNFNLVDEDFVVSPTIPSTWALSNFRPSPGVATSYNAPMQLDGDEDGTIYAGFNNMLADGQVRLVEVTKSTDQGKTWGPHNVMPENLLDQFAAAHGGDIAFQPGLTPYPGGDFIVFGKDEYAFYYRLATGIRSTTDPNQIQSITAYHVVEALYRNGIWSLNAVGELSTLEWNDAELLDSVSTAIGAPAVKFEANGRGHEIQVAFTADKNNVVVKWVEIDTNKRISIPPVRSFTGDAPDYVEGDPIEEIIATDLFIATRARNSTTWSAPNNLTNDQDMAYRTYMPKVVPSLTNIPFLRIIGTGTGTFTSLLPKQVAQIIWNGGSSIDFASSSVVSVENEKNYSFRFGAIAPNPAVGSASVAFTLDHTANVSVELYNTLGARVSATETRMLNAGSHAESVDVSGVPSGTYNAALVVDGVRIMKPFVVVR